MNWIPFLAIHTDCGCVVICAKCVNDLGMNFELLLTIELVNEVIIFFWGGGGGGGNKLFFICFYFRKT